MKFDLENALTDPKSIGFVSDLYPTMVPNISPLSYTAPDKGGRQTEGHTHTHTDGNDHSIVAHFVRGNYNNT